jgi:hypothetical protein
MSAPFTRATTGSLALAAGEEDEFREQPATIASATSAAAPATAALTVRARGFLGESEFDEIMGYPLCGHGRRFGPDSCPIASPLQCPNTGGF